MTTYLPVRINPAAGVVVTLAAFLITACGIEATQMPTTPHLLASVTATSTLTSTPVQPTPTATPIPPTPTHTDMSSPTFTPSPVPTSPIATSTSPVTAVQENSATTPGPETAVQPSVTVSETTIILPTYPIWDYLMEQLDPRYNLPVLYFNRPDFEAVAPTPAPVNYKAVILENAYLKLTFLPELGGRLYSAVLKPDQEIFYHNPVVKPSRYGGLQPPETNWWLAVGGMEWAYPTQEHGYRWGVSWSYRVVQADDRATIILSDMAPGRVGAEVEVTLPADSAAFTVIPRLVNNTAGTVPIQFWLNAALTLGSASMSSRTQFVVPTDTVVVHSRGAEGWLLPEAKDLMTWPQVGTLDLSNYSQWANYLGVFIPNLKAPFMGAYNPDTDLGVVRLIQPGTVPGSKLFAFGPAFPDRSYTDNGSQYFEIWGGANTGFWPEADINLPAGASVQWQESWWPLAALGGITWANQAAAIYLGQNGHTHHLALLAANPRRVTVTVMAGEKLVLTETVSVAPDKPLRWDFKALEGPISVKIASPDGSLLLDYCQEY